MYDLGMFDDLRPLFRHLRWCWELVPGMVVVLDCFSPYDTHSRSHFLFLFLFLFRGRWNSWADLTVDRRAGG